MRTELIERLPCKLSDVEKERKAEELAREVEKHTVLELQKAATAKVLGEQIKQSERRIGELAEQVRTGVENREIALGERRDFERNLMHFYRLDTGEVVSSRPMRADERQAEMMFTATMAAGPGDESDDEDDDEGSAAIGH